jgi:hypothetical protein
MLKQTRKPLQSFHKHQSKSSAWWSIYLQTHPLQSAFALTGSIGGVLLLLFFAQLHAMPELDLAGAGSILLAVALIGLTFIFFLTACAFGGGLALQTFGAEATALRKGRGAWLLHMPVIVCGSGFGWTAWYLDSSDFSIANLTIFPSLGLGAAIYMWWLPGSLKRDWRTKATYAFAYLWLSLLWLMIAGLAVVSFAAMSTQSADGYSQELRMFIWVLWCIVCNFIMAQLEQVKLDGVLVACSLSAVILLLLSNNGMALPKAVVRSLGLGEMPVALVVTEVGCKHLNQASGHEVCQISLNEKSALVCPVLLRSRIGSPYFIGFSKFSPQGAWPADALATRTEAVAIPKTEVLGWSRIDAKPAEKPEVERDASAARKQQGATSLVVTRWNATVQNDWLALQCGLPD